MRRQQFVGTVLALQVAVPTVALALAPAQFGFQMYSGAGWTRVTVVDETGEVERVPIAEYVVRDRIDIDWTERLPERICRDEPSAASVTVTRARAERTIGCPR